MKLLKKLCSIHSPSGEENRISEFIIDYTGVIGFWSIILFLTLFSMVIHFKILPKKIEADFWKKEKKVEGPDDDILLEISVCHGSVINLETTLPDKLPIEFTEFNSLFVTPLTLL